MLSHLNVGAGVDCSIRELAETMARVTGFGGWMMWDASKPDRAPRKLLVVAACGAGVEGWHHAGTGAAGYLRVVPGARSGRLGLRPRRIPSKPLRISCFAQWRASVGYPQTNVGAPWHPFDTRSGQGTCAPSASILCGTSSFVLASILGRRSNLPALRVVQTCAAGSEQQVQ
jgi:hypothetical protein